MCTLRSPSRCSRPLALSWLPLALLLLLLATPIDSALAQATASFHLLMSQGKRLYQQQKFDPALVKFQKALRKLRGKPLYQKVPAYLHIGLCLYQKGHKGLAWKAFEQGLYQNSSASLPPGNSVAIQSFFARVRKRVLQRGGSALGRSTGASATGPSTGGGGGSSAPSPFPWLTLGVGVAGVTLGLVVMLNSAANKTEVDAWIKKAALAGTEPDQVNRAAQPLRDQYEFNNTVGLAVLITGGVLVAGGIVLFFVLPGTKSAPAKSAALAPQKVPAPVAATVLGKY